MAKLLPCPFCAAPDPVLKAKVREGIALVEVSCAGWHCLAGGPLSSSVSMAEAKRIAARKWNTRAAPKDPK